MISYQRKWVGAPPFIPIERAKSTQKDVPPRNVNSEFYGIDARPDGTTEKLFFDVQSGFLVRRSWETRTFFGTLLNATDFDSYRKVGSVWLPFTVRRIRGGTTFVQYISEYRLNVTMDDSIFKKPAPPK
jgi:hypothetical protein